MSHVFRRTVVVLALCTAALVPPRSANAAAKSGADAAQAGAAGPAATTTSAVSPDTAATAIHYELPSTSVTIGIDLTLVRCTGPAVVRPEVTLTTVVGPNPHGEFNFDLDGRSLASFTKSKKIAIDTYPNGSLKSLNGGLSDQTGSIITSVLKIVATIAALDAGPGAGAPSSFAGHCSGKVETALAGIAAMKAEIERQRAVLASADPVRINQAKLAIDALAAEIARLQITSLHLARKFEVTLEPNVRGGVLNLAVADLQPWLNEKWGKDNAAAPLPDLALGFCVGGSDAWVKATGKLVCQPAIVNAAVTAAGTYRPLKPECPTDPGCLQTIVLREPVKAKMAVIAMGSGFGVDPVEPTINAPAGNLLKEADLVISQWGRLSYLPLKVGFGKSINLSMGFDENGHKVSFAWDSTARGVTILAGAASAADAFSGAYKAIDGGQLAADKAEVDRLTTQKSLNSLHACRAILDAGGFACPTQ